ncbi:DUF4340 domain-containing protein [Leptolyngbya sp. PCC 6406]|uniref:DUF4340 domain-containing protein n=1 Tax=Leptolyngbya sp. PCC 6406 TaxID=1173264 RepID=UPI0002ACB2CA|nr:DUF4340 domain-containing protein [Leptolyngbya sp. PCC 6406]
MKLQKTTVALVAIALLLGIGVVIAETRRNPGNAPMGEGAGVGSPVFPFEEGDVTGLHIETQGQEVTFTRDEAGMWQMTAPESVPAESAAIAFLLSRLTSDGLTRRDLTLDATERDDFGLGVPFATVDLTLVDGTTHQLIVGSPDFSGSGVYALVDPEQFPLPQEAAEIPLALLSQDVLNAVDRPLEEWKAVVDGTSETAPDTAPETAPDADAIPSQDDPPVDTPAETLPLPPPPSLE